MTDDARTDHASPADPLDGPARYARQARLPGFGDAAQARLANACVLIAGCGALGSTAADLLARAGIGTLVLVDRDVLEPTNLQRQTLYDEDDVAAGLPKAEAARRRLAKINRHVRLRAEVADMQASNIEAIARDADVLLDGLDSFETRYLLNDLAVATGRPYLHAGAVGFTGTALAVLPHPARRRTTVATRLDPPIAWAEDEAGPCLRCLFPEPPPGGAVDTCDTAGVLGPLAAMVASHAAAEAIKLIACGTAPSASGGPAQGPALERRLVAWDLAEPSIRRLDVAGARRDDCPCCGPAATDHAFAHLDASDAGRTEVLCGRGAVQLAAHGAPPDLDALATRLRTLGPVVRNDFLVRATPDDVRSRRGDPVALTLFADGRTLVHGTDDPAEARSLATRIAGR